MKEGKTKKVSRPIITVEVTSRLVTTNVELLIDFMFVDKIIFLIGLGIPVNFAFVYHASSGRGTSSLWFLLSCAISFWKANSFKVTHIRMDMEGAFSVIIPRIHDLGILAQQASPGDHVPQIERLIQTIKGTIRSMMASVPLLWPKLVLIRAVCVAVRSFNMVPSSVIPDGEVPYTRVFGIKPDFRRDSRLSFLQPCEAMVPYSNNSSDERTSTVFNVGPVDGSPTGAYRLYNPETNKIYHRSQFTIVPISSYHVGILKRLVTKEKSTIGANLRFSRGNDSNASLDFLPDEEVITHHLSEYRPMHEISGILPEINDDYGGPINHSSVISNNDDVIHQSLHIPEEVTAIHQEENFIDASPPLNIMGGDSVNNFHTIDGFDQTTNVVNVDEGDLNNNYNNNNSHNSTDNVDDDNTISNQIIPNLLSGLDGSKWEPTHVKRQSKQPDRLTYAMFHNHGGIMLNNSQLGNVFRVTQTPKQAIQSRGSIAWQALIKEISQLANKGTFQPVYIEDLTPQMKMNIIPSFSFLEDKFDPTRENLSK